MQFVTIKPEGQTSFEVTALVQEWHDFLLAQCGYKEPDHELIARLSAEHAKAYGVTVHEETGVYWDPLSGHFKIPAMLWMACGQTSPVTLEMLDLIWSDCFDDVSVNFFEAIESGLHAEREHGLL